MAEPLLEEVFKTSGVPTHTFVAPSEFPRLIVALRSAGRGVVIEGPSGIGKTTAVTRALEELNRHTGVLRLSARNAEDRGRIAELILQKGFGTAVIDDFHRLDRHTRESLA